MSPSRWTDHDTDLLLAVCGLYDAGIVASGLIAIVTGHLAGGVGIIAIGIPPLAYTLVERVRHQAGRLHGPYVEDKPCSRR